MNQLKDLEQELHKLLQELEFALRKALLAGKAPKPVSQPYRSRYQQWTAKADRFVAITPHAKQMIDHLKTNARKTIDHMVAGAERSHASRSQVKTGLVGKYNEVVSGALADAPGQGSSALNAQIDGAVEKLVFQAIQENKIPANVKREIARNLSQWLKTQDAVNDAFVFLQSSLYDVAKWLHQRLTITAELERTKAEVNKQGQMTPAQAEAADKRVGELAKQRNELDKRIEAEIAKHRTSSRGYVNFSPKLVLDPAKLFVDRLELKAGIKIHRNDVVVDLGTKIRLVDPALDARQLTVNPYANIKVGSDFSAGVEYQGQVQNGQFQHGVKATLSWRF